MCFHRPQDAPLLRRAQNVGCEERRRQQECWKAATRGGRQPALSAPPCERRRWHGCYALAASCNIVAQTKTIAPPTATKHQTALSSQTRQYKHVTGGGWKANTSGNFYSRSSFQINTWRFFFFFSLQITGCAAQWCFKMQPVHESFYACCCEHPGLMQETNKHTNKQKNFSAAQQVF